MRAIAIGLVITMLTLSASDLFARDLPAEAALGATAEAAQAAKAEAAAWRQVAETIPLGSKVRVGLIDGKRVSGTLMRVDSSEVLIKRNTRRPEPARSIAFDQISQIEREHGGGVNVGKAIAIGLATGAGVILGLFILALQLD